MVYHGAHVLLSRREYYIRLIILNRVTAKRTGISRLILGWTVSFINHQTVNLSRSAVLFSYSTRVLHAECREVSGHWWCAALLATRAVMNPEVTYPSRRTLRKLTSPVRARARVLSWCSTSSRPPTCAKSRVRCCAPATTRRATCTPRIGTTSRSYRSGNTTDRSRSRYVVLCRSGWFSC